MTQQQFTQELRRLIKHGQPDALLFPSESDSPIEAVAVSWHRILLWVPEPEEMQAFNTLLDIQLSYIEANDESLIVRWRAVRHAFLAVSDKIQRVYIRPTNQHSQFSIYVLVRFGWFWRGIRATVIYT